jgi:hypothetical protein
MACGTRAWGALLGGGAGPRGAHAPRHLCPALRQRRRSLQAGLKAAALPACSCSARQGRRQDRPRRRRRGPRPAAAAAAAAGGVATHRHRVEARLAGGLPVPAAAAGSRARRGRRQWLSADEKGAPRWLRRPAPGLRRPRCAPPQARRSAASGQLHPAARCQRPHPEPGAAADPLGGSSPAAPVPVPVPPPVPVPVPVPAARPAAVPVAIAVFVPAERCRCSEVWPKRQGDRPKRGPHEAERGQCWSAQTRGATLGWQPCGRARAWPRVHAVPQKRAR